MASLKFKFVPVTDATQLQEGLVLNKVNNQWEWKRGHYVLTNPNETDPEKQVWAPAQAACGKFKKDSDELESTSGYMVKID